jgi:hypothetical protein
MQAIIVWQEKRNAIAQPMEWRFTGFFSNEDARGKLKKLYPTL